MDHAVEGRHRRHGIFEDLVPFTKDEVRRNHHRPALIAFGTSLLIMRPSLPQSAN